MVDNSRPPDHNIVISSRGWRNWQTRYFEVVVSVRTCRFDSCPAQCLLSPSRPTALGSAGPPRRSLHGRSWRGGSTPDRRSCLRGPGAFPAVQYRWSHVQEHIRGARAPAIAKNAECCRWIVRKIICCLGGQARAVSTVGNGRPGTRRRGRRGLHCRWWRRGRCALQQSFCCRGT
jgi:hypothetical protein